METNPNALGGDIANTSGLSAVGKSSALGRSAIFGGRNVSRLASLTDLDFYARQAFDDQRINAIEKAIQRREKIKAAPNKS